ncbi:hypothetical protein [Bacillus taeanensis]|uniref:DUF3993 domain-containing protein n=1 Tax=Bacillus taeanensis TaxID=273032 RepID=A0A366XTY9_9BACI|nr:hypothetical protein [Bacillus taeanensis]RBW69018.1 hypothetical protein DS031_13860 [Bacillus taeanensis]
MKWLQLFLLAGMLALAGCTDAAELEPVDENGLDGEEQTNNENEQENQTNESSENQDNSEEGIDEKIQEPDVEGLAAAFKNYLMQDTDENQKVTNYKNKQELINSFSGVAAPEVAQTYVDDYYEEREDGLYFIAKDAPTWFQENEPYDMEKVNDKHYKVVQESENQITGPYRLIVHFEYQNGAWLITERNIEKL